MPTTIKEISYIPQLKNTNCVIKHLAGWVEHLEKKWDMYYKDGYLPETDIFKRIINHLTCYKGEIDKKIGFIEKIKFPRMSLISNDSQEKTLDNDYVDLQTGNIGGHHKFNLKEIRDFFTGSEQQTEFYKEFYNSKNSNIRNLFIHKFSNIQDTLFKKINSISEVLGILDFEFLNLLTGINAAEVIGTRVAARRSGGVQMIYNAAECLMYDYIQSLDGITDELLEGNNIKKVGLYKGLVTFGQKERQTCYEKFIFTSVPIYVEKNYDYLPILAHEASHIIQYIICNKSEWRWREFDIKKGETYKQHQKYLEKIRDIFKQSLSPLEEFHSCEGINRKAPDSIFYDALITELIADVMATIIAGRSYIYTLVVNYVPICLDSSNGKPPYINFSLASLKMHVCISVGKSLGYWQPNNENFKQIERQIKFIEKQSEVIAKALLFNKESEDNIETKKENEKYNKIVNEFFNISKFDNIKAKLSNKEEGSILDLMKKIIKTPFNRDFDLNKDGDREEYNSILKKTKETFENTVKLEDTSAIWKTKFGEHKILPRHLISILTEPSIPQNKVNEDAILLSLNYHPFIMKRYRD